MTKPITQEQITDFAAFAETRLEGGYEQGYFNLTLHDEFDQTDEDGESLWGFDEEGKYDIFELFQSLEKHDVEIHGHDEFWLVPKK